MKCSANIKQVWVDPVAHEKLWAWTHLARGEVSMLGLIEEHEGAPCITDLFLVKQTCTSANTEMCQDGIARLMVQLVHEGKQDHLRAWVHSHAAMATFWSATDDKTIEGLGGDLFMVSVVVNHAGDVRARVDLFQPLRITIDEVPVKVRLPKLDLEEACRQEFLQKVHEAPMLKLSMAPSHHHFDRGSLLVPPGGKVSGVFDDAELSHMLETGELSLAEYYEIMNDNAELDFDEPTNPEVQHGRR